MINSLKNMNRERKVKRESPWIQGLQKVKDEVMEKDIEKAFCKYAIERGCKPIKFVDPSTKGAPDRLVLCSKSKAFFIEFKAPGGKISEHQKQYHKELNAIGFAVYVCDTVLFACRILDRILKR